MLRLKRPFTEHDTCSGTSFQFHAISAAYKQTPRSVHPLADARQFLGEVDNRVSRGLPGGEPLAAPIHVGPACTDSCHREPVGEAQLQQLLGSDSDLVLLKNSQQVVRPGAQLARPWGGARRGAPQGGGRRWGCWRGGGTRWGCLVGEGI
jgi:hypothetical protein